MCAEHLRDLCERLDSTEFVVGPPDRDKHGFRPQCVLEAFSMYDAVLVRIDMRDRAAHPLYLAETVEYRRVLNGAHYPVRILQGPTLGLLRAGPKKLKCRRNATTREVVHS